MKMVLLTCAVTVISLQVKYPNDINMAYMYIDMWCVLECVLVGGEGGGFFKRS